MEVGRVLGAFWHKGRGEFVEWTTAEIAKRIGKPDDMVAKHLGIMARRDEGTRLVTGSRLPQNSIHGWKLTAEGERCAKWFLRRQ